MHSQIYVAVMLLQTAMGFVDYNPTPEQIEVAKQLVKKAIPFLENASK